MKKNKEVSSNVASVAIEPQIPPTKFKISDYDENLYFA